jgi:hypothetical protein
MAVSGNYSGRKWISIGEQSHLHFDHRKNGRWKSQDKMPVFRGSGTWELEGSILIRVPDLHLKNYSGTREVHREITLLTPQKMVFVITNHPEGGQEGYPKYTFYFTRIK